MYLRKGKLGVKCEDRFVSLRRRTGVETPETARILEGAALQGPDPRRGGKDHAAISRGIKVKVPFEIIYPLEEDVAIYT